MPMGLPPLPAPTVCPTIVKVKAAPTHLILAPGNLPVLQLWFRGRWGYLTLSRHPQAGHPDSPRCPRRGDPRCQQRLKEAGSQLGTGDAGQCHAWEAPSNSPSKAATCEGSRKERQSPHEVSQVWLPWGPRGNGVILFRKTGKWWDCRFKEGQSPGWQPQQRLNSCSSRWPPSGVCPLQWVCGCVCVTDLPAAPPLPQPCPPPGTERSVLP
jgi:hypothetical protein